jgi:hypothetical protein
MTKSEASFLEKVFASEVRAALTGSPRLFQSNSRAAKSLESQGLLIYGKVVLQGRMPVSVVGYELTDAGRIAYCEFCANNGDS